VPFNHINLALTPLKRVEKGEKRVKRRLILDWDAEQQQQEYCEADADACDPNSLRHRERRVNVAYYDGA